MTFFSCPILFHPHIKHCDILPYDPAISHRVSSFFIVFRYFSIGVIVVLQEHCGASLAFVAVFQIVLIFSFCCRPDWCFIVFLFWSIKRTGQRLPTFCKGFPICFVPFQIYFYGLFHCHRVLWCGEFRFKQFFYLFLCFIFSNMLRFFMKGFLVCFILFHKFSDVFNYVAVCSPIRFVLSPDVFLCALFCCNGFSSVSIRFTNLSMYLLVVLQILWYVSFLSSDQGFFICLIVVSTQSLMCFASFHQAS